MSQTIHTNHLMATSGTGSKSGRKAAIIAAVLLVIGGTAAALVMGYFSSRPTNTSKVSADVVAAGLLQVEDIQATKDVSDAVPTVVEFNGHLDGDRRDSYLFYVARSWIDPGTGDVQISNAISAYASASDAQKGLDLLAFGAESLDQEGIGDAMRIYYYEPSDEAAATLAYRFTIGSYSAKVEVALLSDTPRQNDAIKNVLRPIARALATQEEKRLRSVLKQGTAPTNAVMARLPKTITGTGVLGTAPVTAREWRGLERNLDIDTITGYKEGAVRRFQINARPDEVVEIVVMSFDSAAAAKTFQQGLTQKRNTVLDFPADLKNSTVGFREDKHQLMEAQTVSGTYLIDVTVMSPFSELDMLETTKALPGFIREAKKEIEN